jgi:TusE/DsrC/DsvC family sulfur relay protein
MPKSMFGGIELEVDENGFIQETEKWNEAVAEEIAKIEQASPMNPERWKLVNYIRNYYLDYDSAPPIRMLVKQAGLDLKYIYQLFPSGPVKGACKIAGLPKPDGCV